MFFFFAFFILFIYQLKNSRVAAKCRTGPFILGVLQLCVNVFRGRVCLSGVCYGVIEGVWVFVLLRAAEGGTGAFFFGRILRDVDDVQ